MSVAKFPIGSKVTTSVRLTLVGYEYGTALTITTLPNHELKVIGYLQRSGGSVLVVEFTRDDLVFAGIVAAIYAEAV